MGSLYYERRGEPLVFDDVPLAHFRRVLITRMRRSEPLLLNVESSSGEAPVEVLWFHPGIQWRIVLGVDRPPIDPELITAMSRAANASRGITLRTSPSP